MKVYKKTSHKGEKPCLSKKEAHLRATMRNLKKERCLSSPKKELEAEIKKLRKQFAEKDEVIEILKKSVGILSQP